MGSPPREWGQRRSMSCPCSGWRFTPTRVGTASGRWRPPATRTVHPHASGDSPHHFPRVFHRLGSPPREWGQRGHRWHRDPDRRFTPTRVGTAPFTSTWKPRTPVHPHASGDSRLFQTHGPPARVHPHASGDSIDILGEGDGDEGSPPREWGQRLPAVAERFARRFTPTRVGTALPGLR